MALTILAATAVIFMLDWAQSLVISLLLGVVFAYTLNPFVVWLEWLKIPRVMGAAIVIVTVVCALAFGAYSLRGQLQTILTQLPAAVSKLSAGLASMQNAKNSNMQKIQNAASDMEKATSPPTSTPSNRKQSATHVVIAGPKGTDLFHVEKINLSPPIPPKANPDREPGRQKDDITPRESRD